MRGSGAVAGSLAPLTERTFRYAWMLGTKMRDEMIDARDQMA